MLNHSFRYYALMLLAGMAMTFAYAPFSIWLIPFLSLTFTFFLFYKNKEFSPFFSGLVFGIGWFGAGVSWVHVSIANFGGLPLIGSLALMALLVGYLSLFPGLAFWLIGKILNKECWPWAAAAIWFLVEWLRSWFLTGFPWLSIGYTQSGGPLSVWYPIIGETGLSSFLVFICFLLARQLQQISQKNGSFNAPALSIAIIVISTMIVTQVSFLRVNEKPISIAMVQGNIKQELRWVPEQDKPTMDKYLKLTEPLWQNDIILWPEAAIPKLEPLSLEYLQALDSKAFETNTGLITGIVNYNFESYDAYNNLIVLGKTKDTVTAPEYEYFHNNRYAKHHLLPIGEFIPLEDWLRGLAPIFDLPMSSFTRGAYEQANLMVNGYRFLPAICFEIAFPRQIAANLRSHTDFLVTVSNDAWFGHSHGPAQHLEIAQVRAAEFGLPLIRATNNGITAFINHKGDIIAQAPQFKSATLEAQMNTVQGITPYRYWGDWPIWLFTLTTLSWIIYRQRNAHKISEG